MSEIFYRVILTGESEHVDSEAIKTLTQIFDKTEAQMKRLLEFTPIAIRKSVDQETAEQYQTVLIEHGMGVKLEETLDSQQQVEVENNQSEQSDSLSGDDNDMHISWSLEPTENDSQKPTSGKASFSIDED